MGRVLIHHEGALGDVLLSLPCIRAIRRDFGFVHLAGRSAVAGLLKDAGCVDETSSTDNGLYASIYMTGRDARAEDFFRRFDRAFVFTVGNASSPAHGIGKIIPRTTTIITVPPGGARMHVAEFRIMQLGGGQGDVAAPLTMPSFFQEKARELLREAGYDGGRPLVALHPGSGGKGKCWPLENYFSLAERLKRTDGPFVLIFSGPAEGPAMKERIERFVRDRAGMAPVSGQHLGIVAALLTLCDFYIGNDSGVTHLAAATGCAALALFGPTDPVLWRPIGPRVQVVAGADGSLSTIGIDEVYATVEDHLGRGKIG